MSELIEADFIVPLEYGEMRVDQVVARLMPEHSRSRIQSWIKSGSLKVNEQECKPKDKVIMGDVINIHAEVVSRDRWLPEDIPLDILYEDRHIVIINKPAGMVVHPAAGNLNGTLLNGLLFRFPEMDVLPRAGIVHRLDKDTSGLMVAARSLVAHTSLVSQLQDRSMGREYEAVAIGAMTGSGTVDQPIARHAQNRLKMAVHPGGKSAVTHFRVVQRYQGFTHIQCKLETGRTHQIRVHMSYIHHPLVGDPVYGGRVNLPKGCDSAFADYLRGFGRQALHAGKLTLLHPESARQLSWEAPVPADMVDLLARIECHDRRLGD